MPRFLYQAIAEKTPAPVSGGMNRQGLNLLVHPHIHSSDIITLRLALRRRILLNFGIGFNPTFIPWMSINIAYPVVILPLMKYSLSLYCTLSNFLKPCILPVGTCCSLRMPFDCW